MKKMNNKGFSLVELIIVIAIMAILAAALAPQLIKYLEESRKSTDNQACSTIKNCFNAAMNNEAAYKEIVASSGSITIQVSGSTITYTGAGTNTQAELSASLDDIKEPKESGKSKYQISWTVTNNVVSGVEVKTIA